MSKVLVLFNDVHNEETDINGFMTMTQKQSDDYEELLSEINFNFTYTFDNMTLNYFGGEDLLSKLDFKEISNEEFKMLDRIFKGVYGVFIEPNFIQNLITGDDQGNDDEDDDDDDDYFDEDSY